MEVMTGALPSVITKLGCLLIGEYNLQKRVKGEIRFLQAELESMKGAMEKISNTAPEQLDIQDKIWARDLRDLSYDIEDSIDTFMVHGDGNESSDLLPGIRKFIDRSVNLFRKGKTRHEIAAKIRDIKNRVKEVHERRRRYDVNLGVHQTIAITVDPRLFAQYTEVKDLVGIDETRKELINILMEENGVTKQQCKVVSIFGFGGLGKTTLAKQVYEKIRALFDCCAFVSVSQTPDFKKVFKGILYQLDKKKYDSINEKPLDEEQLISEIYEFLQQKRVPGIGNLTSLEELTWLRIDELNSTDTIEELGLLTELRVLRIAVFTEWSDKLAECLLRLNKILVISVIIGHCSIRGFDDWVVPRLRCSLWGFLQPVVFERGAMPKLTRLEFTFWVRVTREITDGEGGGLELGLGYLASLQDICVCFRSEGAGVEEVDEAKVALWHTAEIHPNNPTIHIDQDSDDD
nr:unnamed protein product [Digitaria exilis]